NSNLIYITTRSIKGKSDLWVQKEKAKAPVKIGNFLTEKNSGISYVISQFKYNDKIYYSTPNGIFAVDETNNTFLTDAINCSPFVQKDNFIYALIQRMDNVYGSIKINTENQQVIFKSFPGSPNLVRSFVIENKAIVAGDNLDGGYFDLGDEKFKKFKLNGNEIQTFNIAVSGNNVLFHGFIDGQREFYFWNANTNELKIIPGYGNLFPHVLPDYEGGFFLLPGNAGFGNKIKKMNVLGEIKDLTTVGPGPWYYYIAENGLTGDVHTFPFPGVNEVIFHSEKNGKINVVKVPFENTLYYENFYWQESEETVVVETFINNNYHTWVWKFDEQPYNLTPNGRADRLVSAMIQGDTVILVYFDKEQKRTIFSVYNTINKTLWENASLESYYQSPIKPITSFLFDQSGTFYFSINTTNFGEEMWSYGLKDHSLMLVNDFLPGSISGNPDNLINFNDNVLFTANATDGSRQWFKIRQSIGTSDEGEDHNNSFLFPNPTNDTVFIKKKSKHLLIYDLTGRIRYSGKQLQEGEKIDLSGFEPGLYMVTITTEQGGHAVSKLVVGR
ncbi:MAG TPA: T9SS type A sorting domain-containing protein, partial [Saprospiraceae bacterium]|nr:T9SS type A sorting domain-containing protein [Saprospiraceae bacterium]